MSHPLLPKNADKTAAFVEQYRGETELNVMRGNVDGELIVPRFGFNSDVDAAEDIWSGGGDYTGFPTTAAEIFEVSSSSPNDTAAGTGAQRVRIFYLDDDYNMFDSNGTFLFFEVDLNGSTWVDNATTGVRIWAAEVIRSGSSQTNEGDITVRWKTTTTVIFAVISAGISIAQLSNFTVPAGYTGYIKTIKIWMNDLSANDAQIAVKVIDFGTNTIQLIGPLLLTTEKNIDVELYGGISELAKTDMCIRCLAVTNPNAIIAAHYSIHIVKDSI